MNALEELLRQRGDALLRTATLLAGDRDSGRDLLQAALERALRKRLHGDPEGYVRRVMVNLATDSWRARRRRPEVLADAEPPGHPDPSDAVATRNDLLRALAQLPARQRAVLVLRFFEDRSEAETAELLGCSVGTVKSTASRGLTRLREHTPHPERTHP